MIPSVAVPRSLWHVRGDVVSRHSLDNLSLMALTISTGLVVDDAIVVLENIARHLEDGRPRLEAALEGSREVGFTVLSMSLSLIAVFIPLLFMGGLVGRIFREFAVTLSVAVAVSLVISLTTTPMLCARFLRSERTGDAGTPGFERLRRSYDRTLRWALAHTGITLTFLLFTIALNGYLIAVVPKGFFPQQDNGLMAGTIQASQGTSFQAMQQILSDDVRRLLQDPAIDAIVAIRGSGGTSDQARLFISLKPLGDRRVDADQVTGACDPHCATACRRVSAGPQDIRSAAGARTQYQYTLQGDEMATLSQWAPKLVARLRQEPIVADVNLTSRTAASMFDRCRPDTAARLGVSANASIALRRIRSTAGLDDMRVGSVSRGDGGRARALAAAGPSTPYVAGTNGTRAAFSIARFGRLRPVVDKPSITVPGHAVLQSAPGRRWVMPSQPSIARRVMSACRSAFTNFQGTARVSAVAGRRAVADRGGLAAVTSCSASSAKVVHRSRFCQRCHQLRAMLALAITRTEFTVIASSG